MEKLVEFVVAVRYLVTLGENHHACQRRDQFLSSQTLCKEKRNYLDGLLPGPAMLINSVDRRLEGVSHVQL